MTTSAELRHFTIIIDDDQPPLVLDILRVGIELTELRRNWPHDASEEQQGELFVRLVSGWGVPDPSPQLALRLCALAGEQHERFAAAFLVEAAEIIAALDGADCSFRLPASLLTPTRARVGLA